MNTGFVIETHVIAYCHGCGDPYSVDGEYPTMFVSVDDAAAHFSNDYIVTGWDFDGQVLTCDGCRATRRCEDHGHIWSRSLWSAWNNLPGISIARDRACITCGIYESETQS